MYNKRIDLSLIKNGLKKINIDDNMPDSYCFTNLKNVLIKKKWISIRKVWQYVSFSYTSCGKLINSVSLYL